MLPNHDALNGAFAPDFRISRGCPNPLFNGAIHGFRAMNSGIMRLDGVYWRFFAPHARFPNRISQYPKIAIFLYPIFMVDIAAACA